MITFPGGHRELTALAPQHLFDKFAAQRGRIITAHFTGWKDEPIAGENFDCEVARGKLLDPFDQTWRNGRAYSVDAMAGMTSGVKGDNRLIRGAGNPWPNREVS